MYFIKKGEEMKMLKETFEKINAKLFSVLHSEKGQTMIEYALIAVLIAIVLVLIFKASGVDLGISTAGSKVSSALQ